MGYRFKIIPAAEGYAVTARPEPPQGAGRSFYSDGSLVVHYASAREEATADGPELGTAKTRPGPVQDSK